MLKVNNSSTYKHLIDNDIVPMLHPDHKAYVVRIHKRITDKQFVLILSHINRVANQDYVIVELPSEIRSRENFITETFANIEKILVNLGETYE